MFKIPTTIHLLLLLFSVTTYAAEDLTSDLVFDDKQLEDELIYPDWFDISYGDLTDDLKEATGNGKKGIITYFGQKRCAYCKQFFETSLADTDIQNYLRKHYNVIAFDIWGIEDIIDTDGSKYTERELSIHYKTNFTPHWFFMMKKARRFFAYVAITHLISFAPLCNTSPRCSTKMKPFQNTSNVSTLVTIFFWAD